VKNVVEMGSRAVIYMPGFIKIAWRQSKVDGRGDSQTHKRGWR
jgi:hypothetical protein